MMSMGRGCGSRIPAATARAAWASCPQGTPAMWMRDALADLFVDDDFTAWFPADGRRGIPAARLALVSVLQFAENLTDRQAARAVACRIDWKYALGMKLSEPGFDHSVLCEFRNRLAADARADRLLAVMVERLGAAGLVKRRGRQRTDATHVLAAVRHLTRVELVGETLRAALDAIARSDERWLAALVTPEWVQRYGQPVHWQRLPHGSAETAAYVHQVGADGVRLLQAVYRADTPSVVRGLDAVDVLRQVWVQQYHYDQDGRLAWRQAKDTRARKTREGTVRRVHRDEPNTARVPWSSAEIVSPHDPQARFSHKPGKIAWTGYKDSGKGVSLSRLGFLAVTRPKSHHVKAEW